MEGEAKKRIGRPRKSPEKGRRRACAFRMSQSTLDLVIEAAGRSGRSWSEEIEHRVEASFTADDLRLIVQQEVFSAVRDALAVALASRTDIPGERTEDEPSQRPQ